MSYKDQVNDDEILSIPNDPTILLINDIIDLKIEKNSESSIAET
ncbi:11023_t:CDS:1, partial [Racocetra persica]